MTDFSDAAATRTRHAHPPRTRRSPGRRWRASRRSHHGLEAHVSCQASWPASEAERPFDDGPESMVSRWPVSDEAARSMYAGASGNATAKQYARFWGRLFAIGLFPRRWVTLEVAGRRSGTPMRVPLGMADVAGRWYLVSMLGECNWALNARAANGRVVLHHIRRRKRTLVEVPIESRGPILRRYVDVVPGARAHIPVDRGSSVAEFQAVADQFPIFAVQHAGRTDGQHIKVRRPWPRTTVLLVVGAGVAARSASRSRRGVPPGTEVVRGDARTTSRRGA